MEFWATCLILGFSRISACLGGWVSLVVGYDLLKGRNLSRNLILINICLGWLVFDAGSLALQIMSICSLEIQHQLRLALGALLFISSVAIPLRYSFQLSALCQQPRNVRNTFLASVVCWIALISFSLYLALTERFLVRSAPFLVILPYFFAGQPLALACIFYTLSIVLAIFASTYLMTRIIRRIQQKIPRPEHPNLLRDLRHFRRQLESQLSFNDSGENSFSLPTHQKPSPHIRSILASLNAKIASLVLLYLLHVPLLAMPIYELVSKTRAPPCVELTYAFLMMLGKFLSIFMTLASTSSLRDQVLLRT